MDRADAGPAVPPQRTEDARGTPPRAGFSCRLFQTGRRAFTRIEPSAAPAALAAEGSFVWLDAADPAAAELAGLQRDFGLHPLAVEDVLHAHQRPKIESYGDGADAYWFLILHAATMDGEQLRIHEMAVFAGARVLITMRQDPPYPLEEIEKRWGAHADGAQCEIGYLLYAILDTVVDSYFPVADHFGEQVDALEAQLFGPRPSDNDILRQIFALKRDSQRFRRAALPMRDILAPIMRGDLPLFSGGHEAYFRDVYDHAVRVIDQVDATRDLAQSALDVQLSVTANRQNEVSKQLTLIATIFLPLSFITGFFGQNFTTLTHHIVGPLPFWSMGIATEVAAIAVLVVFFRRRGWF